MKKLVGMGIVMILILSVAANAATSRTSSEERLPSTVYDRLWKKNIPVWTLTDARLETLIKIAPNQKERENLEKLRGKVGRRTTYSRSAAHTVAIEKKKSVANREFSKDTRKLTKEDIADIFGIETIYDPIFKGNKNIHFISRQRLISYLNNPVTQGVSFPKRQEWVRAKLKELGLEERGFKSSVPRIRSTIGPVSKPASTHGLKTRITKIREEGQKYNNRKRYYTLSR